MKKSDTKAIKTLLKNKTSCQWIGFLFDVQNTIIASGDLEELDKKGASDLAENFGKLKDFFQTLKN